MKSIWELTFEDKSAPNGYRVAYVITDLKTKEPIAQFVTEMKKNGVLK